MTAQPDSHQSGSPWRNRYHWRNRVMPVELGPGDSKEVKRGSLVGDDRHGHAQRPGGRAPWERYPAAETPDREGSRTS
ncbi:hypothetical protein ELO62_29680, partial [Klebsiella pneumoniae]|nr:hypothetical protein [Klebsiella pneumoniae]